MPTYLYKITDKLTGKIYIGQTRNIIRRWSEHKNAARSDSPKTYIDQIIKKYGSDNFMYEHIATSKNKFDANCTEIQLIAQYNSMNKNIGYNKSPGGDLFSDEHCKMMSERRKGEGNTFFGKHHSPESIEKISKNHVGFIDKKHSEETIAKMSKSHSGKIFSNEHCENISKSKSGENNYWFGKTIPAEIINKAALSRRKLNDDQEADIRNDPRTAKQIAEEYGVKISLINVIRSKNSRKNKGKK